MTDQHILNAIKDALVGVPPELTGEALRRVVSTTGETYERVSQVWLDNFTGGMN